MARKKAKKSTKKTKKTSKKSLAKRAKAPARRTRKARKAGSSARVSKAPSKSRARKATKKATKRPNRRGADVKGEGNYSASRRFRQKEEGFIKRMGKKIAGLGQNARNALEGSEGVELQSAEAETRERGEGMDQG